MVRYVYLVLPAIEVNLVTVGESKVYHPCDLYVEPGGSVISLGVASQRYIGHTYLHVGTYSGMDTGAGVGLPLQCSKRTTQSHLKLQ